MSVKHTKSNPILDAALAYQFPEYCEEQGIDKVVAFGDYSHKCPIYVRQTPPCTAGCPAGNDIRFWLTTVRHARKRKLSWEESYELAWHKASKTTPFPAVCGRLCPHPCETSCNRSKKEDGAVNINAFERFIGDYGITHGLQHKKLTNKVKAKKAAVIGAGPAGLSCAFQLARRGYPVTVFESFSKPGGMLRYGNPPNRLPPNILDKEIEAIIKMGVKIKCNVVIGKDKSIDNLQAEFDAIFIGIGAHERTKLGIADADVSLGRTEDGKTFVVQCLKTELGKPDDRDRQKPVPTALALAIGHGRTAAERMAAKLEGKRFRPPDQPEIVTSEKMRLNFYKMMERNEQTRLPAAERFKDGLDREIDLGITEEQFRTEAKRCMSCGLCFECRQCLMFCPQSAISAFSQNPLGEVMYTDYNKCVGCHICSQSCPCGYIQMGMGDGL